MDLIFILAGLIIGLVIFFYLLSKYHELEDKKSLDNDVEVLTEEEELKRQRDEVKKEEKLKKRFCPICGTELSENDSLYAEMYNGSPRPRVIIHGCRYCMKPNQNPKK